MYKLLAIVVKEFRLRFSHPLSWLFFAIFPIAFTAVIGAGMGTLLPDAQAPRAPVALVDDDDGVLAGELITALQASEALALQPMDAGQARQAMLDNDVAAVVHIPAGWSEDLLAGRAVEALLSTAIDNRAPAIEQAVEVAVTRVGGLVAIGQATVAEAERLAPFATAADRRAYFEEAVAAARESLARPAVTVQADQPTDEGRRAAGGFAQSSAGQLVAWTLLTMLQGSASLVEERRSGTLRRLLTTPVSKATILGGKILGRLSLGLAQMALLIGVGWAVFRVNWGRDPLALALLALAFALAATSLGLMLATLVQTRAQAASASIGLALLLSVLSSAWWPMDISPPAYQTFIKLFPSTWAVLGFTDIITRGAGVADVLPIAGLLLLYAAIFFAVGLRRFRFE